MDVWPDRQAQVMARWELAGSIGAVAGPLLLTAVLVSGGGGRDGYLVLAGLAAASWLGSCLRGSGPVSPAAQTAAADGGQTQGGETASRPWRARVREVIAALRDWGTLRWLMLLQVADLLVDVFTGFLALYLVEVV